MNADLPASHPSVDFYDSDYPGIGTTLLAENLLGVCLGAARRRIVIASRS